MFSFPAMFTDAQMRELFSAMMDRMVTARWLQSYTFTEGKGFHLQWTLAGAERAAVLKHLATGLGLDQGDARPMAFDKAAHGEDLPVGTRLLGRMPPEVFAYWRESIQQLGCPRTEDDLLVLVQIVTGWAPDAGTGIKLG